jgi:FkbM family methyltransferase
MPPAHKRCIHKRRKDFLNNISPYVREGSTVIDIGGQTGDTMLPMAVAAGLGGKVLVFEMQPESFKLLQYNIGLNRHLDITAYNVAVSNKTETALYETGCGGCNGGLVGAKYTGAANTHVVKTVSLSEFLPANVQSAVSLVKIDTEGHDIVILQAIRHLLHKTRATVWMEWFHGFVSPDCNGPRSSAVCANTCTDASRALFAAVASVGYEAWISEKGVVVGRAVCNSDKWVPDLLLLPKGQDPRSPPTGHRGS